MSDNPTSGRTPTRRSESSSSALLIAKGPHRCPPFIRTSTQPLTRGSRKRTPSSPQSSRRPDQGSSSMREYRIVSDGTATSTRNSVVAVDAHCRGCTVHYREQGPYDETPGSIHWWSKIGRTVSVVAVALWCFLVRNLDLRSFFDTLDHDLLLRAVRHHTKEKWVVLYIERWLKAPVVLSNGEVEERERGTPQGGGSQVRCLPICSRTMCSMLGWDDIFRTFGSSAMPTISFATAAANGKHTTQAGPAGDVRLPGIHALLHDDQARAIPTRAQADVEACQSDPETHRGCVAPAMA